MSKDMAKARVTFGAVEAAEPSPAAQEAAPTAVAVTALRSALRKPPLRLNPGGPDDPRPPWLGPWEYVPDDDSTSQAESEPFSECTALAPGDSVVGGSSGSEPEDIFPESPRSRGSSSQAPVVKSAVADEEGTAEPVTRIRDTQPVFRERAAVAADPRNAAAEQHNQRDDVGNIGFMFGNWGGRAANTGMQDNIDMAIKHALGQILGLCDCEYQTQDLMEGPAVAASPNAQSDFLARPGYEHFTIRGNEPKSNLLAVRVGVASQLDLVFWERTYEGRYSTGKNKGGVKKWANAYSRTLIGKVTLRNQVGFLGNQLTIMVVHLHNKVANHDQGFRKKPGPFLEGS